MPEIGNNNGLNNQQRLIIRISRYKLSFAYHDMAVKGKVVFTPYTIRSGISMAANLREAFKNPDLFPYQVKRSLTLIDSSILLVPLNEYTKEQNETLYNYSFTDYKQNIILDHILPDLEAVALFSINKDLKMVIEDNIPNVRFQPIVSSMWNYLNNRSNGNSNHKLYCYFHDQKLDVFCIEKNRFRFYNRFEASHSRDAVYYMLYVWKLMAFDSKQDEIYMCGEIPDKNWLIEAIKTYIKYVYIINPSADYNRNPITLIKNIPFDLLPHLIS